MTILQNVTSGIPAGKMMIFSAGRQTGKSYYNMKVFKNRYYGTNLCKEIMLPWPKTENPKYKFSRAKWYVADFDDRYYFEVEEWCEQQFGPHPKQPDAWSRWFHKYSDQIHFRDEKDYLMFLLRWG